MRRRRILISLALLGVLLLVIVLREKNIPAPEGTVTITTDKPEYKQGETVQIAVRNGLDKSVWYFKGCASPRFWSLQRLEDGRWKGIYLFLPDLVEEEEVCNFKLCERAEPLELKAKAEINHSWRGTICELPLKVIGIPEVEPKTIEEGTYRVSFTYGLGKKGFDLLEEETVYFEFTIVGR